MTPEEKALAIKSGSKELADEPVETRPLRNRFMALFGASIPLTLLPLLLSPTARADGSIILYIVLGVLPFAVSYVMGFFGTQAFRTVATVADMILWPLLRWIGGALAKAVGGNRRRSFFPDEAEDDAYWEPRSLLTLIPDDHWIPSVGGLAGAYAFCMALTYTLAIAADSFPVLVISALAWVIPAAMVARLFAREVLGSSRVVMGLYWTGLEAVALAGRSARRTYYLTRPAHALQEGVRRAEVDCPYCGTALGDLPALACETCDTPQHADCWKEMGRCSVYACEGEVGKPLVGA